MIVCRMQKASYAMTTIRSMVPTEEAGSCARCSRAATPLYRRLRRLEAAAPPVSLQCGNLWVGKLCSCSKEPND